MDKPHTKVPLPFQVSQAQMAQAAARCQEHVCSLVHAFSLCMNALLDTEPQEPPCLALRETQASLACLSSRQALRAVSWQARAG